MARRGVSVVEEDGVGLLPVDCDGDRLDVSLFFRCINLIPKVAPDSCLR